MGPSWEPAIPQAMQQHGGRNHSPVEVSAASSERPALVSVQVVKPRTAEPERPAPQDWD
jgi:hypothetical protein